jgi:hypothetical protein
MGHYVNGLIARRSALEAAARQLDGARVCSLADEWAFVPITEEVSSSDGRASEHDDFVRLTAEIDAWASEASEHFPIAYVETDYFGGIGSQSAIVWRDGQVAFGPVTTKDFAGEKSVPLPQGAINRALRELGVARGRHRDEFEAVGLHRHRDNEDWIAATHET